MKLTRRCHHAGLLTLSWWCTKAQQDRKVWRVSHALLQNSLWWDGSVLPKLRSPLPWLPNGFHAIGCTDSRARLVSTKATLRPEHASLYPDLARASWYPVVWREHLTLLLDAGPLGLRFGLEQHFELRLGDPGVSLAEPAPMVLPGDTTASTSFQDKPLPAVPRGQGETILLVEESPTLRDLLIEYLERLGWVVVTAEIADQAVAVTRVLRVSLVLVGIDARSGSPGVALARRLRQELPRVPLVLMTGTPEEEIDPDARRLFDAHLAKPFALSDAAWLVRTALQQSVEKA